MEDKMCVKYRRIRKLKDPWINIHDQNQNPSSWPVDEHLEKPDGLIVQA